MQVALWQMAHDESAYGLQAGWWLIVTLDAEDELAGPFQYQEAAEAYAKAQGWDIIGGERA